MSDKIFLATTGNGIARAAATDQGWLVTHLLAGQTVTCLAPDPRDRAVAYAGTRGNGVLRSSDGGQTWLPAGLAGTVVKSLAASSAKPGLVFAGTKPPHLFVSHDGGAHWAEVEPFQRARSWWWRSPAESDLGAYIQGIALSPTDPALILIGIEAGAVLRSLDGGATWEGHRPGALRDCHSICFHAADGDWAYEAGGTGGGAAFSRDGGRTWQQPRAGLDRHYGWAVATDPAQPDLWYVSVSPARASLTRPIPAAHVDGAARAYIFRSRGGAAWQKLGGGLPQPLDYMAYALLTDPAAPGHLYAGLSNGDVWHSTDSGESWAQLPFSLGSIHRMMILL